MSIAVLYDIILSMTSSYHIINNIIISWSSISYQNINDQLHDYIIINIISKYKWSSTWFILLSISYQNINDQVHDLYYYQYHIKI